MSGQRVPPDRARTEGATRRAPAWVAALSLAAAVLGAGPASAQSAATLVTVAGYGNLHAGGVVATVAGDANRDAIATLEWRPLGEPAFRPGHPLVRIDAAHFAGSLFWLAPETTYEVRVALADPDGVAGSPMTALLQTRPDRLPEPTLRTLYVSTGGSDANPGTDPAAPLATIQRAADLAQPGDLVLVQPGVYREAVTVPTSGTAAQPIVFRGSGAGAVLDGADAAIAAGALPWTPAAGGVHTLVTGFATEHVVADRARLYSYGSVAELQALAAGAPGGFHFDGTTLHVKLADGSTPASHVMHVARQENGFYLNRRAHVRIENLEIRHFGAGSFGKGVYLYYSSDVVVRTSRIHSIQAAGVWLKGGDRNRVEDNAIWDTSIAGWPWGLSKGSSAENNAVVFTDDVGRGNVVRRNTIHGTFNGIGPCGSLPPPAGVTNETDLYDNVLFQHTDDAFEPEGHCANVRLWGNRITDAHMAFAVAPAAVGPVYVLRNVAYRVGNTRTSLLDGYVASALKINSGFPTPVGPLYLYHNTFLTDVPSTDAVALLDPGASTFIRARNNLIAGTRYALSKVNPVLLDWDHDDLYTTDPARLVSWQGTRYDTLPALQAATGQELHGLSAPPGLLNPAAGDFRPGPGSPLVDRGVPIPGINDGFAGAAPDVGAVESGGAGGGGGPVRLLTATGPGGGPHVRGFDAAGIPTSPSFFAYDPGFTGGLFLAVGDLDGGGQPHIVTGVGLGGGAHVRAFDLDGAPRATSFLVYPPGFTGGVRVAACDFDGDGRADIVTGAGPGGAPHVRVIALDAAGSPSRDLASFFAYDPAFTGGVFVACGDVDGDRAPDLLVGPDAGGAPHVRVFGRQAGAPGGVGVVPELLAYAPGFTGGIRVAAGNVDGSDRAAIVLGAGPGGGPHVRALKLAGTALVELASFLVYDPGFRNGVFVATGRVTGGAAADIVTSADAGGGPHVRVFTGTGADTGISVFAYDPAFTGGVRVGALP